MHAGWLNVAVGNVASLIPKEHILTNLPNHHFLSSAVTFWFLYGSFDPFGFTLLLPGLEIYIDTL